MKHVQRLWLQRTDGYRQPCLRYSTPPRSSNQTRPSLTTTNTPTNYPQQPHTYTGLHRRRSTPNARTHNPTHQTSHHTYAQPNLTKLRTLTRDTLRTSFSSRAGQGSIDWPAASPVRMAALVGRSPLAYKPQPTSCPPPEALTSSLSWVLGLISSEVLCTLASAFPLHV